MTTPDRPTVPTPDPDAPAPAGTADPLAPTPDPDAPPPAKAAPGGPARRRPAVRKAAPTKVAVTADPADSPTADAPPAKEAAPARKAAVGEAAPAKKAAPAKRVGPANKAAPAKEVAPAAADPADDSVDLDAAGEPEKAARPAPVATLCIDVGGSGVKGATIGPDGSMLADRVRLDTTYPLPPGGLVDLIAEIARRSPAAKRVSIGFPGMVRAGRVLSAPHFVTKSGPGSKVVPDLTKKWDRFDLAGAVGDRLGIPVRLANDADTQGLAAIEGKGLELVITLGTGIGTAVFLDGTLAPHLELSHHPLSKTGTYNDYVGDRALKKLGPKKWSKRVDETVAVLQALTFYDRLYVGGGNASTLTKHFTHEATVVDNADGILGGARLWTLHRVP